MKIDRLVSIIMLLLDKNRVGAQTLADLFEVSPRTIYRDIDAICRAGIPIASTAGVGGGFEILQNYKITKNVFSSSDLSAILMGLSSLSNMLRGDDLVKAFAKVKSFIPADRAEDIELKARQIYIDLSPWMGNRNLQSNLELIKTALQEHKVLSFEYADRYGNRTERSAEPYQLVLKSSQWYLYGYCYTRRDFRLFKLNRTANMQMQEQVFKPQNYQKPQLDFPETLKPQQKRITLRIHTSIMDRVLDYSAYEDFSPDGDEHWIVSFPFIENDYYYTILFSFGNACECLAPLHIRAEMKRRIQLLATVYDT